MILKKDLINGKIVYVEVTEEEARELYKENTKLFFNSEDEEADFYEKMADMDADEQELYEEDEDEKDNDGVFCKTDWKEIGRRAKELSEEIGRKVSAFTEKVINSDAFNIRNYNEKTKKLVGILPFMDDDDIHELIQEMLKNKDAFNDIDIRAIFPFLEEDDCDAIFLSVLDGGNYDIRLKDIVPFVSSECLTKVVDLYLEGKFSDREIEKIYPFLSSEDIKRVFKHMMSEESKEKQATISLLFSS